MFRLKFSFFLCFITIFGLLAQEHAVDIGQIKTIHSEILNEARQIAVYTPSDYNNSDQKYPVLYVLDGEWNFHYTSALAEKLAAAGDMPQTIVIGIINTNRNRDLTPPEANSNPNRFGGGEKFLNFISRELQPWVSKNYRTAPFNILAGHSFGGLFTIYAMMEQPGLFQSYIALSPSLGRNNEKQIEVAKQFFNTETVLPNDLYIALANEGGFTKSSTLKFVEIAKSKVAQEGRFKFEELPNESHFSIPVPGFLNGLQFIYKGVNPEKIVGLDEIFLIEAHFKGLSERFGYDFPIPEYYYKKFTEEQIGARELEYALFILNKYEANYPDTIDLFRLYADVYLLKGDFKKAKSYYERLKKMGVESESLTAILDKIKE